MRDFSKVAPNVWKSRKFWALPDDSARLAYLYILTNPHANSAGCYDLPILYACADLRWLPQAYKEAIASLCDAGLIDFDHVENTVRIVNWMAFNEPTNPKHALGMLVQLSQASADHLKIKQFNDFKEVVERRKYTDDKHLAKAMQVFFEGLRKPICTKTETKIQTEKETKTRLDQDKTEMAPDGACAESAAPPAFEVPELPRVLDRRFQTAFLSKAPDVSHETAAMKRTA